MKPNRLCSEFLLSVMLLAQGCGSNVSERPTAIYDVRTFGATGDGKTLDSVALQRAIDACSRNGGGTVLIAGGRFLTGTLYLRSHAHLRIDSGAVLLGSANISDYTTDTDRTMYRGEPHMDRCLIFARDAQDIAIEGAGTIDGQGKSFPQPGDPGRNRPKMIRFIGCSQVRVRGLTLLNPASWTSEWRYCSDMDFSSVTIHSRANINGDGLDFDGCSHVRVTHSSFDTSDDSICLQTSSTNIPCDDIAISRCVFMSRWAGVRIGLLSRGDFTHVSVSDCDFHDHRDSGVKIQLNEGGEMSDMSFTHLRMTNVPRPVFITFCRENAWVDASPEPPAMKRLHDLRFSDITVDSSTGGTGAGFIITGMPGYRIENLSFTDIRAAFPGGGTAEDARDVLAEFTPENLRGRWPEYSGLRGTVPAFGFYARHVRGLVLDNVSLTTKSPDSRPATAFVDVVGERLERAPEPVRTAELR